MSEDPEDADGGDAGGEDAGGGDATTSEPTRDAPLSDLRRDVEERRRRDDGDDAADLFTDVDVGEIDEDELWEQLESSGDDPLYTTEESEGGREVSVVNKRLCHECPHFADPPELSCTHEGTEIDAEVDTERFRVLDCPMVDRPEHADAAGLSEDGD
ncbi:hypothetical protein [Halobacterium zhouii]|uniref:hypothetical protein n=1 Tax=Halobacterium zhouii TaxID=2902624 RepID=UPI001E61B4A6|nr:hypothetical protein [Halobacterium zhouii]